QYGTALIDKRRLRVSSHSNTDAGFVSQELMLPAGAYRLHATLDSSDLSEKPGSNAGHLSLHGNGMIYAITQATAAHQPITA
ncbi:hypothetical protein RA269_28625, partial [Pseudomonas syringae pv. tagetis]